MIWGGIWEHLAYSFSIILSNWIILNGFIDLDLTASLHFRPSFRLSLMRADGYCEVEAEYTLKAQVQHIRNEMR
jgi:hypothetical protein